jgi:hypothetical protein
MTIRQRFPAIAAVCLTLILGASFFVLPSLGSRIFLSPDETAAVAAGRAFAKSGSMVFSLSEDHAAPWIHPRSFVTQISGAMVPVGFLGMPVLFGIASRIFSDWIFVLGTPLLVLSVVIPLWFLMRSFGRTAQFAAIVTWLTFPTVILYANRGMFPNLPTVCLTIWSVYLLLHWKKIPSLIVVGILTGLALAIRPVEAVWILPWIGLAFLERERGKRIAFKADRAIYLIFSCLGVCLLFAWIGKETYGEWFKAGYQLRDPILSDGSLRMSGVQNLPAYVLSETGAETVASKSWFDTWPFGFHPRNVWFNVKWYLIVFLLPWFVLAHGAMIVAWKKEKRLRGLILVMCLATASLCLLYGQGLYQDHVRANFVSVGNSFLRYLLPFAAIASLSIGWLAGWTEKRLSRSGRPVVIAVVVCLGIYGLWSATVRDDEGLRQNRIELQKYAETRERAAQFLSADAVVVSERSDKIFFPVWQAVSPMVSKDRLKQFLIAEPNRLAFFLRTLTPEQQDTWRADGFALKPVLEMGNETLYLASPL